MSHYSWLALIGCVIFFLCFFLVLYFIKHNVRKAWKIVVEIVGFISGIIAIAYFIGSLLKPGLPEVVEKNQVVNETGCTDTAEPSIQVTRHNEYGNNKRFNVVDKTRIDNMVIANIKNNEDYWRFDVTVMVVDSSCMRLYNANEFPKDVCPNGNFCVKFTVDLDKYASVINNRDEDALRSAGSFTIECRNYTNTYTDVIELDLSELFGQQ